MDIFSFSPFTTTGDIFEYILVLVAIVIFVGSLMIGSISLYRFVFVYKHKDDKRLRARYTLLAAVLLVLVSLVVMSRYDSMY